MENGARKFLILKTFLFCLLLCTGIFSINQCKISSKKDSFIPAGYRNFTGICKKGYLLDKNGNCVKWSAPYGFIIPRKLESRVLLKNGMLLIVGGAIKNNLSKSEKILYADTSELYDPQKGRSIALHNMHEAHFYTEPALLNNGKVLIAGGIKFHFSLNYHKKKFKAEDARKALSTTLEVFDPLTEKWSAYPFKCEIAGVKIVPFKKSDAIIIGNCKRGSDLMPDKRVWLYQDKTNSLIELSALKTGLRHIIKFYPHPRGAYLIGFDMKTSKFIAKIYDVKKQSCLPVNGPLGNGSSFCFTIRLSNGRLLFFDNKSGSNKYKVWLSNSVQTKWTNQHDYQGELSSLISLPGNFQNKIIIKSGLDSIVFYDYKTGVGKTIELEYSDMNNITALYNSHILISTNDDKHILYDLNREKQVLIYPYISYYDGRICSDKKNVYIADTSNDNCNFYAMSKSDHKWKKLPAIKGESRLLYFFSMSEGTLLVIGKNIWYYKKESGWEKRKSLNKELVYYPCTGKEAIRLNDNSILLMGAKDDPRYIARYYLDKDSWAILARPEDRHSQLTLLSDGRVLASGGESTEIYTPGKNQWLKTRNTPMPRKSHATVLLSDGRVLLCGGETLKNYNSFKDSWIYTPATNQWHRTGDMPDWVYSHHLTLCKDGKVFTMKDYACYIFDPQREIWYSSIPSIFKADNPESTLLPDGKIFIFSRKCGPHFLTIEQTGFSNMVNFPEYEFPPERKKNKMAPYEKFLRNREYLQRKRNVNLAMARCLAKSRSLNCENAKYFKNSLDNIKIRPYNIMKHPMVKIAPELNDAVSLNINYKSSRKTTYRLQQEQYIEQKPGPEVLTNMQLDITNSVVKKYKDGSVDIDVTIENKSGVLFVDYIGSVAKSIKSFFPFQGFRMKVTKNGGLKDIDIKTSGIQKNDLEKVRMLKPMLKNILNIQVPSRLVKPGEKWSLVMDHKLDDISIKDADVKGKLNSKTIYKYLGQSLVGNTYYAAIEVKIKLQGYGEIKSKSYQFLTGQTGRGYGLILWDMKAGELFYSQSVIEIVQTISDDYNCIHMRSTMARIK